MRCTDLTLEASGDFHRVDFLSIVFCLYVVGSNRKIPVSLLSELIRKLCFLYVACKARRAMHRYTLEDKFAKSLNLFRLW